MKFAATILLSAMLAAPTLAAAQDSTNQLPAAPSTDCTVGGGCNPTGTGSQPNTDPDSTLKGGTAGSGSDGSGSGGSGSGSDTGSGPLGNTGSGSTSDPGDSSGSSGSGSGGAAGPLNNTTPQ